LLRLCRQGGDATADVVVFYYFLCHSVAESRRRRTTTEPRFMCANAHTNLNNDLGVKVQPQDDTTSLKLRSAACDRRDKKGGAGVTKERWK
jgi:hypothetical protein